MSKRLSDTDLERLIEHAADDMDGDDVLSMATELRELRAFRDAVLAWDDVRPTRTYTDAEKRAARDLDKAMKSERARLSQAGGEDKA